MLVNFKTPNITCPFNQVADLAADNNDNFQNIIKTFIDDFII